jgi:membrane associated rhomboid family serine protease
VSESPFETSPPPDSPPFQPAPRRQRLPWEAPDLFDPKPDISDYGYVTRGKPHPCSLAELEDKIARGWGRIPLVWTPDSPRLIAAAEAPEIFQAVRTRLIRRTTFSGIRSIVIGAGIAGAILLDAFLEHQPLGDMLSFVVTILLFFAAFPASQAFRSVGVLRTFGVRDVLAQGRPARYEFWLRQRNPHATWLIAVCIAMVAVGQIHAGWDASIDVGALIKPLPPGQWWRLFSCILMHGGFVHLGVNLFSLLVVGRWTEAHSKSFYVPVVFLLTALCASFASLHFNTETSVGASGGIMGLIGFLAVMGYRRRNVLPDGFFSLIIANVILICGMGIAAHAVVDNAAHAGGFAAGVALGLLVFSRPTVRRAGMFTIISGVAAALVLVAVAIFTTTRLWQAARMQAAIDSLPPMVRLAPGQMDATAQFTYVYGRNDKFHVLSGRQITAQGGGPTIDILRGAFQSPGWYLFRFEELDELQAVFQTRTVRVMAAPATPTGPVTISPDDRQWFQYQEGIVLAPLNATATIQWLEHSPNTPGHWHLADIAYNPPRGKQ